MKQKNKSHDRFDAIVIGAISLTFIMAAVLTPLAQGQQGSYPSSSDTGTSSSSSSMMPPIVNPTNVQTDNESVLHVFQGNPNDFPGLGPPVINGITALSDSSFPRDSALSGPVTGISVRYKPGTQYKVINDYLVDLTQGEIFVSVKSPSKMAMVKTPFGEVAVGANGDVLVSFNNGTMRVMNLDGTGHQVIKVQLNQGPFGTPQTDPTVTINAGYELVAADRTLTRTDMRPRDGIARRKFKLLENGHMAISEISVESVMKANDVIADIRQNATGVKERRIMGDLSKMAAVLNYRNGTQGFSVEE